MTIENQANKAKAAYIVRVNPGEVNKLAETLESNQVILGWAVVKNMLHAKSQHKVKELLTKHYPKESQRVVDQWAGSIYRFLKKIKKGDYIIIPTASAMYIAIAQSDEAIYLPEKEQEDSSYRRDATFINAKQKIQRKFASTALQLRLKSRQTVTNASDLVSDIEQLVNEVESKSTKTFAQDLREALIDKALEKLQEGKINDHTFEEVIKELLIKTGCKNAKIISRSKDKGVDVLAEYRFAGFVPIQIAVQAKHFNDRKPIGIKVVKQLTNGINHEDFNSDIPTIAMIITTGIFTEDLEQKIEEENLLQDSPHCISLQLVDGTQLAGLLIENGLVS